MRDEGAIKGWRLGANSPEPILKIIEVADANVCLFWRASIRWLLMRTPCIKSFQGRESAGLSGSRRTGFCSTADASTSEAFASSIAQPGGGEGGGPCGG
jgi:hypothetical protein